jgi:hypothetical protein
MSCSLTFVSEMWAGFETEQQQQVPQVLGLSPGGVPLDQQLRQVCRPGRYPPFHLRQDENSNKLFE